MITSSEFVEFGGGRGKTNDATSSKLRLTYLLLPSFFFRFCHAEHIGTDADLVLLEMSVNDFRM